MSGGRTFRCLPDRARVFAGRWADVPGNVLVASHLTNLPHDSVANASQVISLDESLLTERVGKLTRAKLELVLASLDAVLER